MGTISTFTVALSPPPHLIPHGQFVSLPFMTRLEVDFALNEVHARVRDKDEDLHLEPVGIGFPTNSRFLLLNISDAVEILA